MKKILLTILALAGFTGVGFVTKLGKLTVKSSDDLASSAFQSNVTSIKRAESSERQKGVDGLLDAEALTKTTEILPIYEEEKKHEIGIQLDADSKVYRVFVTGTDSKFIPSKNIQVVRTKKGDLIMSAGLKGQGTCVINLKNGDHCYLPINELRVKYLGEVDK